MKKWRQIWVQCLECGDKITNGMECQCNGVRVTPLGEIHSYEGNSYHVQKTKGKEDEERWKLD